LKESGKIFGTAGRAGCRGDDMTLYENIIAYGDAREKLAELRDDLALAQLRVSRDTSCIEWQVDTAEMNVENLLKDIELQLDLFSIDQR
jgi:hypothetical protein